MGHSDFKALGAARDAAILGCFEAYLLHQEVSSSGRTTLLDAARRFLHWIEGGDDLVDRLHAADASDELWRIREKFLRADCPDRDCRHDVRAHLNQFLRFLVPMRGYHSG
ncbi:hypothetical protein HLB44_12595 [Aquincola sp. S2]|uniref:Core-binding (CB) domain-containing protein n=1 Tax=Pseudaquabacterium terrae TaxID=2732868 RepID=A0ABX2EGV7_9BURK|nr:hypothetical protein [Aquabacterium terrae]NRF67824.1 hypothetical protein [Aquabacterium terrae]